MSKHVPDTAAANAALDTAREPSRRDHLPYQVRHLDEIDWETIRWPGETGKMLFHPSPEQPTAPNAGILRLEPGAHHPEHYHGFAQVWFILNGEILIVQYPGPSTGERPIYAGRFNMETRKALAEERVDL
jgi:mannose-6-phosphate isomerase-like protein (cupin superfamily)